MTKLVKSKENLRHRTLTTSLIKKTACTGSNFVAQPPRGRHRLSFGALSWNRGIIVISWKYRDIVELSCYRDFIVIVRNLCYCSSYYRYSTKCVKSSIVRPLPWICSFKWGMVALSDIRSGWVTAQNVELTCLRPAQIKNMLKNGYFKKKCYPYLRFPEPSLNQIQLAYISLFFRANS